MVSWLLFVSVTVSLLQFKLVVFCRLRAHSSRTWCLQRQRTTELFRPSSGFALQTALQEELEHGSSVVYTSGNTCPDSPPRWPGTVCVPRRLLQEHEAGVSAPAMSTVEGASRPGASPGLPRLPPGKEVPDGGLVTWFCLSLANDKHKGSRTWDFPCSLVPSGGWMLESHPITEFCKPRANVGQRE